MYASIIGKKLVKIRNSTNKEEITVEQFWEQVFIPFFFDHPKYLMTGGNTPLENPKIAWKKGIFPSSANRKKRIENLKLNISKGIPNTSNTPMAESLDAEATTSGQITSLSLPLNIDDIYASWIGLGLGVGIAGGLSLLFDREEILNLIFEGWKRYRALLNETPSLKGNQIDTWNGQWLYFALNNKNYDRLPLPVAESDKDSSSIPTLSWIRLLFALARRFPNETLNVYVYSLGQTNTTIGFIQINLPQIKSEIDMYYSLFGKLQSMTLLAIDEVYNTQYGFKRACQNGVIGLAEIEPKQMREYFPERGKEPAFPKLKDDEKSVINYNIYLSWVLAMLNSSTAIQMAEELAKALLKYAGDADRAKKTRENDINALFKAVSRKNFIEALTEILKEDTSSAVLFNSLVDDIDKLQADKFPYFLTLVKFKYIYFKSTK